ncbi:MAG: sel1 repeat family protein [Nitrosomonas sp.]|nr:sel1 repeat family protein [Nitrosomonas sp.]
MRIMRKNNRAIILIIIALTVLSLIPTLSAAGQPQPDTRKALAEAQQWLTAGDYPKAYAAFLFHARTQQHPLAQFTLGLFHQHGWGMAVDKVQACRWYEKAAENGVPAANHFLGECYQDGTHQPINYTAAIHWYQAAADLGHIVSLCSIAELVMQGKGVPKDPEKALNLCQQAATAGSVNAQLQLGQFYLDGDESIRNPILAAKWFSHAAGKELLEAYYYLGKIHENDFNDPATALSWYEMAASRGYPPAYFPTARLYFNAPVAEHTQMPTAENLAKAYLWLSATRQLSENMHEVHTIEDMLKKVEQIMPASWKKDLDRKVSQHIKEFHG